MIGFILLEKFILNLGYLLIKYCIEEVCLNIEMGEIWLIFLIFLEFWRDMFEFKSLNYI